MNDKQLRAEIESRTATYESAFSIKDGSVVTDKQGRTSATGIIRREYVAFDSDTKRFTPTGERYEVEVQVYRPDLRQLGNGVLVYRDRDGNPWLPVGGEIAIRAAALALPAAIGRQVIKGGKLANVKTYGTQKEKAAARAEWQRVIDELYREDTARNFKELLALASEKVRQPNGKLASSRTIRRYVKNPRKESLE